MNKNDRFEDERFKNLTDKLSTTFEQQGDRFEPSSDAYARLAEAVNQPNPARGPSWWIRPLSVGVAAVAVLGVGGFLLSQQGVNTVDTGPGLEAAADDIPGPGDAPEGDAAASESMPADGEQTTETEGSDETDAGDDPSAEDSPAGSLAGPIASTRLEAGQAFLDLLDYPFASVELDGDQVVVRSFLEGGRSVDGQGTIAATLTVVEMGGGYAVIEASTDSVSILAIDTADLAGGDLLVSGEGTGFEGTLSVALIGVDGGRTLASTFTNAGSLGEQQPYRVSVPVVGSEQAWVVVGSFGGASGVTEPFAARPVSYSSIDDPTDYTVVGVNLDDPDGGLKVRSGPGVGNDSFTVLTPGATGIRRTNVFPVSVGDDVWWAIDVDGGNQGWVNSRFLASGASVDSAQLDRIAADARTAIPAIADQEDPSSAVEPSVPLSFSTRLPVAIGWVGAPTTEAGPQLQYLEAWMRARSLELPADYGELFQGSMFDFHRADAWTDASIVEGGTFTYDSDREAAEAYFGGLDSVVIEAENPSGPWDRTHIYVEQTPTGPEIVGFVLEVMQP